MYSAPTLLNCGPNGAFRTELMSTYVHSSIMHVSVVIDSTDMAVHLSGEDDCRQLINGATIAAEQDSLLAADVLVDGGDVNDVKVKGTVLGDQRATSPAAFNRESTKRKKKSSSRSRGT